MRVRASRARTSGLVSKFESLRKDVVAEREKTEQLRQAAEAVVAATANGTRSVERSLRNAKRPPERSRINSSYWPASWRRIAGCARFRRAAQQVAEVEAEAARAALEQARREADPAARHAGTRAGGGADGRGQRASRRLANKFAAASQEGAEIGRLNELAKRQEELAALARPSPAIAPMADRVQAEQQAVRDELDTLLKKTPALEPGARRAGARGRATGWPGALWPTGSARNRGGRSILESAVESSSELAELQRELEDDARQLAAEVDQPLGENGRGRLNTDGIRQAGLPIERGDVEGARERLEAAENELRRLTRDLEDVPADPKALAGRLFRRQDALNRDIERLLHSVAGKTA